MQPSTFAISVRELLWQRLYIDTALPFGLGSAPKIFTVIADAAEWIAHRLGIKFVIHYLDDFLIIGGPASNECAIALKMLTELFVWLGLPLAVEKREGPSTCIKFLGFVLNTHYFKIRLPHRNLVELQTLVRSWVGRRTCVKRELESLAGKLAHASRVVKPGKMFMRRLFELLGGVRQGYHHVRINASCQSDILLWDTFLESWNGTSMIQPSVRGQTAVHIWTDASGLVGCRALNPATKRWLQLKWPEDNVFGGVLLREESITFKELLPIVLACAVWARDFCGLCVTVHCDNLGTVALVNSGYPNYAFTSLPVFH